MTFSKYQSILFVGAPCAGKGTQAKLLTQRNNSYFHFSSGEMFRYLLTQEDLPAELEQKISGINQGNFVNDETTIQCVQETLERYVKAGIYQPEKQYLILDGVPRNVPQVGMMGALVKVNQVINFIVDEENILIHRFQKRALEEGRQDDQNPSILKHRIEKYWRDTFPLIAQYENVVNLDGIGIIENVYSRLKKVLLKR